MRSRFILLSLAACFVFASVDNADARAGKGFRYSSSSSGKTDSTSAASSQSTSRSGDSASQAMSSFRGASNQRPQTDGAVGYRPASANQSNYYLTGPFKPASAAPPAPATAASAPTPSVAGPVPAPVVASPTPTAPTGMATPTAAETLVRVATKKYSDPNSSDACPPPYVFDSMNGCRSKGAR